MFGEDEAEVFRKGDDVLIRMRGFGFGVGKSEIRSRNYPMLNKLIAAINTFPGSRAIITGHTDSRGSEKRNLELSAARAQSVVQFLTTVGGVEPQRLTAEGKGESEPVAPNETADGRAKNRRIDVLIKNPPAPAATQPVAKAEATSAPEAETDADAATKTSPAAKAAQPGKASEAAAE
jgi:outer membrane protein OmpA-like peptidoglycan-associated protein